MSIASTNYPSLPYGLDWPTVASMEPPTPPASHQDLLDRPLFAHLATVRPDGSPQSGMMWFAWDGNRARFSHTRTRQKVRNVAYEPRVSFHLVDPENPYRTLEVRGRVESIDADPDAAFYRSLQERYTWSFLSSTPTSASSSRWHRPHSSPSTEDSPTTSWLRSPSDSQPTSGQTMTSRGLRIRLASARNEWRPRPAIADRVVDVSVPVAATSRCPGSALR